MTNEHLDKCQPTNITLDEQNTESICRRGLGYKTIYDEILPHVCLVGHCHWIYLITNTHSKLFNSFTVSLVTFQICCSTIHISANVTYTMTDIIHITTSFNQLLKSNINTNSLCLIMSHVVNFTTSWSFTLSVLVLLMCWKVATHVNLRVQAKNESSW